MCSTHHDSRHWVIGVSLVACLTIFTSCKWVKVESSVVNPKQGDNLTFTITAGESSDIERIEYSIGSQSGSTTNVPHTVNVNTCKTPSTYLTNISVSVTATWDDGRVKTFGESIDLTVCESSREDADRTYTLYIADENDGTINDVRSGWANAFQDEFDTYSETQYYWSQPRFFTTDALSHGNSADMTIFSGHGSPHEYRAGPSGSDWVDFTDTEFGGFAPCYNTGDCEYLVSGSCQLLSMNDIGSSSFRHFWRHYNSTKSDTRSFTGLHVLCGFRTDHFYYYWWFFGWHSSSTGFFEAFAKKLDAGHSVRYAWIDACGDELDFGGGNNRGAVFYLRPYQYSSLSSNQDDLIYGNGSYFLDAEFWE